MKNEVELKYKINRIPHVCKKFELIYQYYFNFNKKKNILTQLFNELPLETIKEARVRVLVSKKDEIFLTLKTEGDVSRLEYEQQIDEETAKLLLKDNVIGIVQKRRYEAKAKGFVFEFDEYLNLPQKLFTVEIESNNKLDEFDVNKIETALKNVFSVEFLDVTNNKTYKNKNLAKQGKFIKAEELEN